MQPINPDIRKAATLAGAFYADAALYAKSMDRVFAASWQFVGHRTEWPKQMHIPLTLLPGALDEPLLLRTGADDVAGIYSNVCTHRGFILVEAPRPVAQIRCRYHGRCFHEDGRFKSMPEFEGTTDFPAASDHLPSLAFEQWNGFSFTSIQPTSIFQDVFAPLNDRLSFFAFDTLQHRPDLSKEYTVQAHWALYCDNYLEGFHIPYVHASLNKVIDYGQYETHLFPWCNLQIGIARDGEPAFDLPAKSPDFGKQVAAYYVWIFPNLMVNVYPWGISVNIVQPQGLRSTKVRFETYVANPALLDKGAGSGLHDVEMEDEAVVESVDKGVRSRLYSAGRFSPSMEKGVHHFHQLLASALNS